jgi:hypothetical protein
MQKVPYATIINDIQYFTPMRLPKMVDKDWAVTNMMESYAGGIRINGDAWRRYDRTRSLPVKQH